ncbi:uncharacterized protein LOC124818701 [Hydra vulgaris]|uniref:uncharacterized protein LOC124818701 n=1 Tax=Hydra vulgaris TaxID=6087 RepID=UPI001F5E5EB2|nr:uncharacterized protein LOC124818701 [Hydra vulgaris]
MEKIKKHFVKIFQSNDFCISIQCNMKIVNYLNVTLDLNSNSFRPYAKPDNELIYVHCDSNHPPNVIKRLQRTGEIRLSTTSSNEVVFNNTTPSYEEAFKKAGYNCKLTYQPQVTSPKNKNRKRNIIWYNPPFSLNVETKIGNRLLALVDLHFPVNRKLRKIFNRNSIKVSYSCMQNIKCIISSHNHKILQSKRNITTKTCNCITKTACPLSNQCLVSNIVYQATVSSNDPDPKEKVYFGISETPFKLRYANHFKSFNAIKYKNDTELSKEIWSLKEKGTTPIIKWKVIKRCEAYKPETKACKLCLHDKLEILSFNGNNLLNKKDEILSKCRHLNKFLLSSIAPFQITSELVLP